AQRWGSAQETLGVVKTTLERIRRAVVRGSIPGDRGVLTLQVVLESLGTGQRLCQLGLLLVGHLAPLYEVLDVLQQHVDGISRARVLVRGLPERIADVRVR